MEIVPSLRESSLIGIIIDKEFLLKIAEVSAKGSVMFNLILSNVIANFVLRIEEFF